MLFFFLKKQPQSQSQPLCRSRFPRRQSQPQPQPLVGSGEWKGLGRKSGTSAQTLTSGSTSGYGRPFHSPAQHSDDSDDAFIFGPRPLSKPDGGSGIRSGDESVETGLRAGAEVGGPRTGRLVEPWNLNDNRV